MVVKIQKKSHLKEAKTVIDNRIKIAFYLYEAKKPLTLSEISKRTELSPQLVKHHLPIMIQEGILLCGSHDNRKSYILQSFFYDDTIMDSIFASLVPIATFIDSKELTTEYTDVSKQQVMLNCIQVLIHFVNLEITKIKSELKSDFK